MTRRSLASRRSLPSRRSLASRRSLPPRRLALLALLLWLLGALAPAATAKEARRASAPTPTADGAVLWDPADGRALFGVEEDVARPMASTTKIMTILLALESGALDETVTVSAHAAAVGRQPGVATLALEAGQQVPMRELLAALLLGSGNDGAVAVAEHVAGGEAAFVDKMNARAAELDLEDTRFVNPTGLTDDPGHHASPRDLARLGAVAMGNADFAAWAGAAALTLPEFGTVVNRNELLGSYRGADGIKTGYTGLAGPCLVASATRQGRRLLAVVLDADERFGDSAELLDYGFEAFRRAEPVDPGETVTRYRWAGTQVRLTAADGLGRTVRSGRAAAWRTVIEPAAQLPVAEGEVLGRAELVIGERVVETTQLRAATSVAAAPRRSAAADAGSAVQEAVRAFARLHHADREA